jgi:hypothetical protein
MFNEKTIEYLYKSALLWICDMLLYDKIRLKDIPFEIRTSDTGTYVVAFRLSREISRERLFEDITILCEDICALEEDYFCREQLLSKLADNIWRDSYFGDSREKQDYEDFRKTISEKLLREVRESDRIRAEHLRTELEKYGLIQRNQNSQQSQTLQ